MDYLDPLEQHRHVTQLYVRYVLVAIVVILSVVVLLLIAVGYSINRQGQVVQNGLVFVSSKPDAANIYLSGVLNSHQTNTRLNIASGSYSLKLQRAGYRDWQTGITVVGNQVIRYNYPFLFPTTLKPTTVKTYAAAPGIVTQTPDKRYLLVEPRPGAPSFDVYDLKNPKQAPTTLTIPSADFAASTTQSWHVVAWADDKVHLLLKHSYGTKGNTEFVLLDRSDAAQTVNLSATFKSSPTEVKLQNNKYDHYYLYFAATHLLQTATLSQPQPVTLLKDVLAYLPYQSDTVLYIAPSSDKNLVDVHILKGDQTYTLRQLSAQAHYLMDMGSYSDTLYTAVADADKGLIYVYKDALGQLTSSDANAALPLYTMQLKAPTFVNFSAGAQYLIAESGTRFAAYDLEYKRHYSYTQPATLDSGQPHAAWMDGAHLQYVSKGALRVFDFDGSNAQQLMPARSPADEVFYDSGYKFVYAIAKSTDAKTKAVTYNLTGTSLLTPADQ